MVVVHRNNLVLSDDVTTSLDKSIYLYNFFFVFAILITNASRGRKRKLVKNQNINQEKKIIVKRSVAVSRKNGEKRHIFGTGYFSCFGCRNDFCYIVITNCKLGLGKLCFLLLLFNCSFCFLVVPCDDTSHFSLVCLDCFASIPFLKR